MLWSIDSCQNRVSFPLTSITWSPVSPAQVSTHRGQVFFEVIRLQVTSFQMIAGSSLIFLKFILNMLCFCAAEFKILISNWPRTQKFSQLLQAGKTVAFDFAHHGHALVTLYVQFLCSDWSKVNRWVHAENLCSILNLVYFASWRWQSFVSTCNVFDCLLSTGCTKLNSAVIRSLLSFMASLFIGFLVEKYVTCQSRKSDFGWHRFCFSPCLMRKSEAILALLDTFQGCISNGKPE